MRIKELTIHNFRNLYGATQVEFSGGDLLIAAAPNATGKTNFLESLVMLLRGKSFRASNEECVSWDKDYFLVRGVVDVGGQERSLAVQYHIPSKKMRIEEDGEPVSPVTFYGQYPVILFLPEDTFIFYRGPAARRNLINTTLVSSSQYLSFVVQYQRSLRQRNGALKDSSNKEQVAVWSDLLVRYAQEVWSGRQALVDYLNSHVSELYASLFDEEYEFEVSLIPGAPNVEQYRTILDDSWEYEQRYRYTLYGPHRDDIRVTIGGRDAASVLSRGQMRSLVIAFKVASFGYIRNIVGTTPLLLFDEVLSELDEKRQQTLLDHLPDAQILLTCTAVPEGFKGRDNAHFLDLGSIIQSDKEKSSGADVEVVQGEEGQQVSVQV